ncbi:hypothetical protein D3C73_1251610 [compost metagenome]
MVKENPSKLRFTLYEVAPLTAIQLKSTFRSPAVAFNPAGAESDVIIDVSRDNVLSAPPAKALTW